MQYKITTPVAVEPVTLAEVKLHLRRSPETMASDTTTYQSIAPGNHVTAASYSLIGSSVSVAGKTAIVNLNAGTNGVGGTVAAKIQESDNATDWTDYTGGGFTTVTEANDNAIQELSYAGTKTYIRVVATVAVATCGFSVDVVVSTGDNVEDSDLSSLITVAREWCEKYTGRAFATQTIKLFLDKFPSANYIELPMAPLQSVTSVVYKDHEATETTMTPTTDYIVDTDSNVGRVVLAYGKSWPSFTPYPINPITITCVAGYTTIPKSLKQAMLLLISHWYNNREAVLMGTISKKIEFSVDALLSMYRNRWWS